MLPLFVFMIAVGVSFILISYSKKQEKEAKTFKLRIQGILLLILSLILALSQNPYILSDLMMTIIILNIPIYIVLTPVGLFLVVKSYVKKNEGSDKISDVRIIGYAILLASAIYHTFLFFLGSKSILREIGIIASSYVTPAIAFLAIFLRLFIRKLSYDLFLRIFSWSFICFFLAVFSIGSTLENALPAYLQNNCSKKLIEIAMNQEIILSEYGKYANWDELIELGYIDADKTMDNYIEEYSIAIFDVNPEIIDANDFTHPDSFTIVAIPKNQKKYHHVIRAICEDGKIRKCYDSVENFDLSNINLNDEEYWEFRR